MSSVYIYESPTNGVDQSLRDILSRDADGIALDQYAASYPCELRALASCVVDALEVQRCAAEVLDQLCEYSTRPDARAPTD